MHILRIEHAVPDFVAWKKAFDSDPLGRQRSGVRRYRVLRPVDDARYVLVDLEFDTLAQAEATHGALRQLWGQVEGKVIEKGRARIVEVFLLDGSITFDGSWTLGNSVTNAVRRHELRQEGFPTSGISTTPLLDRARFYATQGGSVQGYVLKIDRSLLSRFTVTEYVVKEWVNNPSVPEDLEVILVAADFGPLPGDIVVEILQV